MEKGGEPVCARKGKCSAGDNGVTLIKCRQGRCKVCHAVVPRRKEYCPSVCEACQKFFSRNCRRVHDVATCSTGGSCSVVELKKRRFCRYCRFQKCLAVGMQSKFLSEKSNYSDKKSISPPNSDEICTSDEANGTKVVPCLLEEKASLLPDPVLFDGSSIEGILRTSIRAFPTLHAFEFLPLKDRTRPVLDIGTFLERGAENLEAVFGILQSYGSEFTGLFGGLLSDEQLRSLGATSLVSFTTIYDNFVASPAGSSFMGMTEETRDRFFTWFPECRQQNETCKQLAEALKSWNPSLVEASILFSYLLFNGGRSHSTSLLRCRRRFCDYLQLAFNLYCCQQIKSAEADPSTCLETNRRHFANCLRLVADIVAQTQRCMADIADRAPILALASTVIGQDDKNNANTT